MVIDIEKIKNKEKQQKTLEASGNFFQKFITRIREVTTISSRDKQFFVQNLQVMISGGLPLDRSLKTLSSQTKNLKFKKILNDLYLDTEKGLTFAESLSKHKGTFSEMFINMVQAGEISGRLDEVLKQIYIQIKKANELKSNVKSAMTYPVIVVVAMVSIGIGMLIFVIPKITAMFDDFGGDLPLPTKMLIGTSDFIVSNGILVSLVAIILITLFIVFIRSSKGKYIFHGFLLSLPIFGPIISKINLAKFTRNLSSLIKTDIPIVKTFEITSQILGNAHYRKALLEASQKLKKGSSIAETLEMYPKLFPPVIIQMTVTGEETGKVDDILSELASFYEDEIDRIMKTLPSIIEPLLMLILGAGVGLMAVAIIMPMYSITEKI
ncbi:type II secretion system F family protein [Patescibacteria group bacterium]|nr:type II secretion system F family protein [Patescibacteria group bacterium]